MRNYVFVALPLLLALTCIPSVLSAVSSSCFTFPDRLFCKAYTDKPFYSPGDAGKLIIDLKNINNYTVKINNLTIAFPWAAYVNGQWDGNSTVTVNVNVTGNQWMQEQTIPFTVPNDGRFPSSVFGSTGTVQFAYTSYCPTCDKGQYEQTTVSFSISPNAFLLSTGWQAMSDYLLYTDVLLAALVVLFLVYVIWSRQKGPAIPRVMPST